MRAPRIIKEVYANVYDSKFDDDKGSKEKEEQKSSSKDSKEDKQKFSPSLTSPKEDKTRNFAPKLAETDKKDGSFKPSLSDSKEAKNDAFKPKLNPEPKNSEKSFTPSLEMPGKREKRFKPVLNDASNIEEIRNSLSRLSSKFIEYNNYAKNLGKDKVPNLYPNRGTRITNKFTNWIEENENDPIKVKEILNQVEGINNGKDIQEIIKNEIFTTNNSAKGIARNFKDYGINVSPHTVKSTALNHIYNNNIQKFNERFPTGTGSFLNEKYSLDKNSMTFENIDLLQEKFKQYHDLAKENNLLTQYANRGAKITNQFIKWIRDNEKNFDSRTELINAAKSITKNGEIPQYVMNKTVNSTLSMRSISEELREKGIYLSHHAIGNYARDHILNDDKAKIERFPSSKDLGNIPKELYEKVRDEVNKYYPIPLRWVCKKMDVNRSTVHKIAKNENTREEYERKWPAREKITTEIRDSVVNDIKNTNLNLSKIADSYGISPHTVKKFAKKDIFKSDIKSYNERFPLTDIHRHLGTSTHHCILDELTRFFDKNQENFYAEPKIYPGESKGCDGLILNDNKFLQDRLKDSNNSEDLSLLVHGIPVSSLDNQFDHIKGIHFDFTNDITDENIINKCVKYERPDLMLYIVGTHWYPYDPIKTLPNDKSIKFPENNNVISHELFADFIGLKGESKNIFGQIINLNYEEDVDSLVRIHKENNLNWNNKARLKEDLIAKGLVKRSINEYFKIPRQSKQVQKKLF